MSNEIIAANNTAIQNTSAFAIPEGYICTLDITSIDGKMMLATTLNDAQSMKDMTEKPMRVTDIVTTSGTRSRTGEVCTNVYIICDDGTSYFTQSDGIARSVKILKAMFTDANTGAWTQPVSQGIGFMVKEKILPNGNTLKTMVPVKLD